MSIFSRRTSRQEAEIERLDKQVKALTEQNTKLSIESTERFHTILELRKEMSARDERIRELEAETERYRSVADRLQAENEMVHTQLHETQMRELKRGDALDDLLALVHKIAEGVNIRTGNTGGAELVKQARDLIKQYDSPSDKPLIKE